MIALAGVGALLLDVEGTTTPLAFVHDVLFPYSRERLPGFLGAHAQEPGLRADLEGLRAEHARDLAAGAAPPAWAGADPTEAAAYAAWLIDRDRKAGPLKSLQGRIWEEGYRSGALQGQVYPDVAPAFERWTRAGQTLAIFSSGSVLAQRLLFGHSQAGDLERFLSAHFDTTTGPKREAASYARIAAALGRGGPEVLFLSDVEAELDAARAAGLRTGLVARDSPPASTAHPWVQDFSQIG